MAPLMCASVSDIYGNNFGLSSEQIVQQSLKNNETCANKNAQYQKKLKEQEIAGKANFKDFNENDNNIPPEYSNFNQSPNAPQQSINNSNFAKRLAWTDKNNNRPSNQGLSIFNRFQKEYFVGTDSECLQQIATLMSEVILIIKIIMFVLILLLIIKLLEKKG
jgi:hypothetical protein